MLQYPTEEIAARSIEERTGQFVAWIERFRTGNQHYVYDVLLNDNRALVIRMTLPQEKERMRGAVMWNARLRALGLPLPKIFDVHLENYFPYILMERIAGRDLGEELERMNDNEMQTLANQLMSYQRTVAKLPSHGFFGYAAASEKAPFKKWREVLDHSIARSRKRMSDAGFVGLSCIEKAERLLLQCGPDLERVNATPFLHDITTKNVIISEGKLTGIVDVDDLCYGDPLFQIALTRMAILSSGTNTRYIDFLLEKFGNYSKDLLRAYTVKCCVGFLSELGQAFNGNVPTSSEQRRDFLLSILKDL